MDYTTLGGLALTGTIVSLIVSFIKAKAGESGNFAKVLVIVVSLLGGAVYYFLKDTSYWQSFLIILGWANLIYTILIQFFDDGIKKLVGP